jgi:SAM-dependent methyltransferase
MSSDDPRWFFDPDLGSREHYRDALLYDHGYKRRRADVEHYRRLALRLRGPVLELGCGSGRIALPLIKEGIDVVGIDLSADMLARGAERYRSVAGASKGRLHLVQADLRRFALARRFPLVICAFNTFMHLYEIDDIQAALQRVREHLAPGGTFALDVLNPDLKYLSRPPFRRYSRTRFKDPQTGETWSYSENSAYDRVRQIAFIRLFYERESDGQLKVVRLAHRQFFPEELRLYLVRAGFSIRRRSGDFYGAPLTSESESQIILASHAEEAPAGDG